MARAFAVALALGVALAACARIARPPAPPAAPSPKPPAASPKEAGRQILSSERPCLTRDQARRARRALFAGAARRDGARWIMAINDALHLLGADCDDEDFLALLLATIALESGVAADPPLAERDLETLFLRKLAKLREDNLLAAGLISLSDLDAVLRVKLRRDTARGRIRSEGELVRYVEDDLRPWLQVHLRETYLVPEGLAALAAERWLPASVMTLGPMQVNAVKAFRNARARGESIASPEAMRGLLLDSRTALERGVLEGTALLLKSYRHYRARLPAEQAVFFAGTDYNAGEFSARNAAFQEMVSRLLQRPLALDGDLLAYRDGVAEDEVSRSEGAVLRLLAEFTPEAIRRDLLLEKEAAFSASPVARAVCDRFRREIGGPCPEARIPQGAGNPGAGIKLGRAYTPANYARALHARYRKMRELLGR